MLLRTVFVGAVVAGASGCGGDPSPKPPGGETPPGCDASDAACGCAEPLTARADGEGCIEISPEHDCPAGTMAAMGSRECRPVGWMSACPTGMETDDSGWGCIDVQPSEPCAGATMEVLGQPTCQPIGDCDGAFPPADATLFVDDDYGEGSLDGTHFATIGDALAAAAANAVIAVEAGVYIESLDVADALHIVGRCAGEVVVESPDGQAPGVQVIGVGGVTVRGMTLRGHRAGVGVMDGDVTVADCLIEGSSLVGAVAVEGGTLRVERSRIVDTSQEAGEWGANVSIEAESVAEIVDSSLVRGSRHGLTAAGAGSFVSLVRSIVRDTLPDATGEFGKGVVVGLGATGSIVQSAIIDNRAANVAVGSGAGSHLEVTRSVLRGAVEDGFGSLGDGLEVLDDAEADVDSTAIVGNMGFGIAVSTGGRLRVQASIVRGSGGVDPGRRGRGAAALAGGSLELSDCALVELDDAGVLVQESGSRGAIRTTLVRGVRMTEYTTPGDGYGVFAGFGAVVEIGDSTVMDVDRVGLLLGGVGADGSPSSAVVTRALIAGTRPAHSSLFGRGVEVIDGASLTLDDSAVIGSHELGVSVGMAASRAVLHGGVVRATGLGGSGDFGHGVLAQQGAIAVLQGANVIDNLRVGLLFSAASGDVIGVLVADNAVGIHAQSGSSLHELGEVPGEPLPSIVRVSTDTRFVGNDTRVGTGVVPVPTPIGP